MQDMRLRCLSSHDVVTSDQRNVWLDLVLTGQSGPCQHMYEYLDDQSRVFLSQQCKLSRKWWSRTVLVTIEPIRVLLPGAQALWRDHWRLGAPSWGMRWPDEGVHQREPLLADDAGVVRWHSTKMSLTHTMMAGEATLNLAEYQLHCDFLDIRVLMVSPLVAHSGDSTECDTLSVILPQGVQQVIHIDIMKAPAHGPALARMPTRLYIACAPDTDAIPSLVVSRVDSLSLVSVGSGILDAESHFSLIGDPLTVVDLDVDAEPLEVSPGTPKLKKLSLQLERVVWISNKLAVRHLDARYTQSVGRWGDVEGLQRFRVRTPLNLPRLGGILSIPGHHVWQAPPDGNDFSHFMDITTDGCVPEIDQTVGSLHVRWASRERRLTWSADVQQVTTLILEDTTGVCQTDGNEYYLSRMAHTVPSGVCTLSLTFDDLQRMMVIEGSHLTTAGLTVHMRRPCSTSLSTHAAMWYDSREVSDQGDECSLGCLMLSQVSARQGRLIVVDSRLDCDASAQYDVRCDRCMADLTAHSMGTTKAKLHMVEMIYQLCTNCHSNWSEVSVQVETD
jgi:hypothetical protein